MSSAQSIWHASEKDFLAVGVSPKIAKKIVDGRKKIKFDAQALADFCEKQNINILIHSDKNYPEQLKNICKPPLAIFVKGHLPDRQDVIAIVGSRKASSYGLSIAKEFAADLAKAGYLIVSGGAKGIDTAAHNGTLSVHGHTVAVLGCGIDVVYPAENKKLFEQIIYENGALVSEFLPGEPPIDWHFPIRNRIISGIAKGVLVVEAHKKSGSLITAKFSVDENREVYCVPGSIYSAGSIGVHNLIKEGAMLVDSPEDIIDDLSTLFRQKELIFDKKFDNNNLPDDLGDDAKTVYECMIGGKQYSAEEIIMICGIEPARVSFSLLELEMAGWLAVDAGIYQKKKG